MTNTVKPDIGGNARYVDDHIAEVNSLRPALHLNRRGFMATSAATTLGVGFAAATQPVQAQTMIKTDTQGLKVGEIKLVGVDGYSFPAYMAAPEGKTQLPVVIVFSEIFGVHEHIADVCRRFAKLGYLAIAPEYFVRAGDAKSYTDIPKLQADIIMKTPDAQVMSDTDAAVAWAIANGGSQRIAVTGFCWGGRMTWLYAAHSDKVKAAVAWYGRVNGATSPAFPQHPVNIAAQLKAPVLGLYGGVDTGIPLTAVDEMMAALSKAGTATAKTSTIHVYDQSPHAFHADYRPSYRKDDAQDGWQRLQAWFKANGV